MIVLVDRATGMIVERHEKNFDDFLKNEWGGMFPFKKDGLFHVGYGTILGCERYDKYWQDWEDYYKERE